MYVVFASARRSQFGLIQTRKKKIKTQVRRLILNACRQNPGIHTSRLCKNHIPVLSVSQVHSVLKCMETRFHELTQVDGCHWYIQNPRVSSNLTHSMESWL